jgi:3-isopropylmalate dehydrogenase
MKKNIAVVPGDFIGAEVTAQAVSVLRAVAERFGHEFIFTEADAGGAALDKYGVPLPPETLDICRASDAVQLGAVGGAAENSGWYTKPPELRPEQALLSLRRELGLFANLRPAVLHRQLIGACPLKSEIIGGGIDIMVVRELTGGIYFGERGRTENGTAAYDMERYSRDEVRRIAAVAFETAMKRDRRVVSVDKANVLESSRLWREVVNEAAGEYPNAALEHMYVDNAAMQLIRDPRRFDVLLTTNMFGDILSDEASQIVGSIGMLPSASLDGSGFGMYEPIHGSAPDIAGQNKANPIAAILSAAMMLRYSFGMEAEAAAVERAVSDVLDEGWRTGDIMAVGCRLAGTEEMGGMIVNKLKETSKNPLPKLAIM